MVKYSLGRHSHSNECQGRFHPNTKQKKQEKKTKEKKTKQNKNKKIKNEKKKEKK